MNEASFRELLIRRNESRLTIHDFCSNEGIPESTYYYWKNKLNKRATQPKGFIPLLVNNHFPAQKKNQGSRIIPASSEIHWQDDVPMEFVFPNGTRLMLRNQFDPAFLQAIVHLYD